MNKRLFSDKSSGSAHWPTSDLKGQNVVDTSMTQSDSGSFTTWSKLKKRSSDQQLRRLPSGNNNNSGDDATRLGLIDTSAKSQSMPNLYKQKLKNLIVSQLAKSQTSSVSEIVNCFRSVLIKQARLIAMLNESSVYSSFS